MSNGFVGFFHLQTPEDLFLKLRRDYARLQKNPADSDAAFDFFVTATHLPDWLHNAGRPHAAPIDARDKALLGICAHLGNGAKHFVVNRHDAVQHGDVGVTTCGFGSTFGAAPFGAVPFGGGSWQVRDDLIVTLSPDEAAALGTPTTSAYDLADRTLGYWTKHFGL